MVRFHFLSLILVILIFQGCNSGRRTVQIDRSSSAELAKQKSLADKEKKESFIRQTSGTGETPIKSELEVEKEKSLINRNPISKLIGKLNNKPKHIPLPRTDLNSDPDKMLSESFEAKEPEIPEEDISF